MLRAGLAFALLIAGLMLALLLVSTLAQATSGQGFVPDPIAGVIVIGDDNGGGLDDHNKFYNRIYQAGVPVRVEGTCVSACTLVLTFGPERVCVTAKASFGFHNASIAGQQNGDLTAMLSRRFYPPSVQTWIRQHGPLKEDPIYLSAEEAIELGAVKPCAG